MLSLPFDLRVRLAFHHDLVLALTRIATQEIDRRYRELALAAGLSNPRGGSVTVIHRASGDLRPNLHLHALFLDGAYGEAHTGERRFHAAPAPTPDEVEAILARILERARPVLAVGEDQGEALDDEDRALAQTYAGAAGSTGTERHAPDDEGGGLVLLPTRRKAPSRRVRPRRRSRRARARP